MQNSDGAEISDETAMPEAPQLSAIELRVLGSLMEKQLTTPDQYPLTVNGIITASNQKSSRDPVSNYQQGEVMRALQALEDRRLVRKDYGSRAEKFSQQLMQHIEQGKKQQAVLCIMMLRGPQTLSELDTRTQRMAQFIDRDDLVHCIERLCDREPPYAIRLGHLPGQRGERFGHLFSGIPELGSFSSSSDSDRAASSVQQKGQDARQLLDLEVAELRESVKTLESDNIVLKLQIERLYELTGYAIEHPDES